MKQQEVFNKIGGIIKEINEQYRSIEDNPADLNELELELFIANTHFLVNHAEILGKLSAKIRVDTPVEPTKTGSEEKYFEPVVQLPNDNDPPLYIDLSRGTAEDTFPNTTQEPEVIRHELVIDEADLGDESEEDEKPDMPFAAKPVSSLKDAVKSAVRKAADVKEEVFTINQKISAQLGEKGGITEQVNTQPINDLKQAITLNDKLLYVKDLFNGYSLSYSEAIDILNRFNTFEEAERFLNKNYTVKNDWVGKPDTTDKFYAILKRRYV